MPGVESGHRTFARRQSGDCLSSYSASRALHAESVGPTGRPCSSARRRCRKRQTAGSVARPFARSVEEDLSLLESPHRPFRSADELVSLASRFRESTPDGAGKDPTALGASQGWHLLRARLGRAGTGCAQSRAGQAPFQSPRSRRSAPRPCRVSIPIAATRLLGSQSGIHTPWSRMASYIASG